MQLHRPLPLPDGGSVRLRLPHTADRTGLHDLLGHLGLEPDDLEVRRMLRCVPRRRLALCAIGWDEGRERVVGFGALEDGALTLLGPPEVADVLAEALDAHAHSWSRRVA